MLCYCIAIILQSSTARTKCSTPATPSRDGMVHVIHVIFPPTQQPSPGHTYQLNREIYAQKLLPESGKYPSTSILQLGWNYAKLVQIFSIRNHWIFHISIANAKCICCIIFSVLCCLYCAEVWKGRSSCHYNMSILQSSPGGGRLQWLHPYSYRPCWQN